MPVHKKQSSVGLTHPKGSSLEILFYGATIISWKSFSPTIQSSSPEERLFLSSKASLDGARPVRGGIPIVFPVFGPPTKLEHMKLSQHGFARSETWSFDDIVLDDESGVSIRLGLIPSSSVLEKYPFACKLGYTVTLAEHQLTTRLQVDNKGLSAMEFQILLHTYHRVPACQVKVTPLKGVTYLNKTKPGTPKEVESRDGVDVLSFTDFVYEKATAPSNGCYTLGWDGQNRVEVLSNGFEDLVIWNPGQVNGAKMGDMEESGWEKFVCVEPGYVSSFVKLEPSCIWTGQQVISIL